MKEIYINNDKVQARIHEWGNPDNTTILCFHGLGSTSLSFIELGYFLTNKYHVISIDLPGHGKTPAFLKEEDYEMPNMVIWIDKIISALIDKKFFILAHSWGASIALQYICKYPSKVIKTILLDGGYYIKTDLYSYQASKARDIDSLEKEIEYYIKDFDEYCFDTIEEHINLEKSNYIRWSDFLEEATRDLTRFEDGKYKYHANGFTAVAAIKSMYLYPPNYIYDKLPNSILLLQSTLPESMNEIREILVEKFKKGTETNVKKIVGASHMIHWDKPNEVIDELLNWFNN